MYVAKIPQTLEQLEQYTYEVYASISIEIAADGSKPRHYYLHVTAKRDGHVESIVMRYALLAEDFKLADNFNISSPALILYSSS
ncbi:hypothetical protein CDAR_446081 [Caerostris darwini]|uniref:Uncharacterized protein n=1 Tax=Caerostris darwini TaxID=1538125 RepID=A0AAV4SUV5_9ARAC|nr:hypothetical protein CDAR_446081 [Caerostris darwini]